MKIKLICAFSSLWLATPLLLAQTAAPEPLGPVPTVAQAQAEMDRFRTSELGSELFYQLLIAELTAQNGEPAAGFALLLDAARKSNDAQLYQRATDIALQSRSGDAALQAATAWQQAQPSSREANRYILQILIALNRLSATTQPLKAEIEMAPASERTQAMAAIPRVFARVTDKKLAASVVEEAIKPYLAGSVDKAVASAAWTAVARMRLAAGDSSGAVEAVQRAQVADPRSEGPVLVALEMMDSKLPAAEGVVKSFITDNASSKVLPDIRMAYARALLDAQRYSEASTQLQIALREKPDFSSAWLVLGSLQLQDNQLAQAQTSLERYIALATKQADDEEPAKGLAQAYLALAQVAEKRKDFAAAEGWIAKIENPEDMMQAQVRRASILASQGKLAEGRQLIKALPERSPADARLKLMAEIGLLRELKQYQLAYELLGQAALKLPAETELLYDRAMMAEKIGKLDEMERLLRQLIQAKPDYHSAYNALGYSFADRNMRLPEARDLIRKALEFVPADPFIQDSLGWVEFRMGNKAEALKIFEIAYKAKPDAEIAAHFGEVLWSLGQRDRAMAIWREGRMLSPDNETLMETLKRLQVKL